MFGTTVVERIGEWLAELGTEELAGRPNAELSARLLELATLKERIEAEVVRTAAQWDAAAWADDGALSAASWLAFRTAMPRADAVRLVRAGRLVQSHDLTADALRAGVVSAPQVDTLATVARGREELYAEHEATLVQAADGLTADSFTVVARRWRSLADDQLAREDAYDVFERRHLHVSSTLFGTVRLDGELDPEGGATFLAALDALDAPDPVDGPVPARSLSQRRADCLVQLATMSSSSEAGSGRAPVRASVIADVGMLAGAPPNDWSAVHLELERVGPIARDTARRLTCDAAIGRVLMAGRSEVLDLGRSTRMVAPALRRAVELRDCGCRGPGCDRPPEWCDAHHIVHWAAGGATDLDNLVLLCRRHHVLLHEGGWHLARGPDGSVTFIRPADRTGPELVLAT